MLRCFSNEITSRYFELRKDIITKENILKEFSDFMNSIPKEAYQKENERWKDIPGFGIEQIEEYLDFRIPFLDNLMNDMKNR